MPQWDPGLSPVVRRWLHTGVAHARTSAIVIMVLYVNPHAPLCARGAEKRAPLSGGRFLTTILRWDRHSRFARGVSETSMEPGQRHATVLRSGPHTSDSSYWLHELSYSSLESNDSGYTQQPWLPDELCGHCMLCQQEFHLWRWMHHCRRVP